MNKTELINAVAEKSGLSKVDAKKALDATLEAITEEVKAGGKVVLVGFGTFAVSERSARKGINPRTKKPIDIPAKKTTKFKAGAGLSDL
ncbi:MAG TPA: DNA-binding protein [Porphyromonadaceae bacterium]|jgi:DNA-binding protein HU-beta|uniref:HU family DNA-binding protein n=1 Tax=Limibacterium fermenti TaxID=3229863 RepID=UPI000E95CD95|nr:DNA-binding protein [Porphyromonadaceae bacterium]HBK30305.1 DNA-binding protein [Porphyromonadaceae bacterium]HBL32575.1 DNA-binding protein [Porphyromonadaceae bacterium]HBX20874.1 DNA-binding protein [Porphyromonadaceae bacterium]HBX46853.1 DNA-binding protein [Porphyromonadaceae bacterium]